MIDPLYQRAMEFAKNLQHHSDHHVGISNVYVLQTIDRDGNITDEKYGMNLMTDYGMTHYFVNTESFPTNIYIGNGSSAFDHTTNALVNPITSTASTLVTTTRDFNYPLYFDRTTGVITCTCKYMEGYFNYTISDVTNDVDISEYGIGTAYNALWTHSWVYNQLGQRDVITKKLNERLYITVYFCMSYTSALINNAWDEGKFIAITSMERFFNRSNATMEENSIKTFKRYDIASSRTKTHAMSTFLNNRVTLTTNMSNITITSDQNDTNEYVDGVASWNSGFEMIERLLMDSAIPFDTMNYPTGEFVDQSDGFSYSFGKVARFPFTSANITASYSYNYNDQLYNSPDYFYNNPDKWYTNTMFGPQFALPIRYTNNNTIQTVYLYINMDTSDPIVSINGDILTIYATDTYWDTSSWEQITDRSIVPATLRNKKYWITSSNSVNMDPVRASHAFEFLDRNSNRAPEHSFSDMDYGLKPCVSNETNGWYCVGRYIYHPTTNISYDTHVDPNYVFCYGNTLVSVNGTNVKFITDPFGSPIETNATLSTSIMASHVTDSKMGYVLTKPVGSTTTTFEIIDIINQTVISKSSTCVDACCIPFTTYYAYIDGTDQRTIYVKEITDDSLIQTFIVDSNLNYLKNVWGYRDLLYFSDGTSYGRVGNIQSGSISSTSSTYLTLYNYDLQYFRMDAMDECAVVYHSTNYSYSSSVLSEYKYPTVLRRLTEFYSSGINYITGLHLQLTRVNQNTIVLIATSQQTQLTNSLHIFGYDLGKYMATSQFVSTKDSVHITPKANMMMPVAYGDFIFSGNLSYPIANMVSHRLVGDTRCVSTCNAYKNISNKSWSLTLTNIGTYQGPPPGNQQ